MSLRQAAIAQVYSSEACKPTLTWRGGDVGRQSRRFRLWRQNAEWIPRIKEACDLSTNSIAGLTPDLFRQIPGLSPTPQHGCEPCRLWVVEKRPGRPIGNAGGAAGGH